ncbi:MAG TPA: Gfo/Idh/MocA family oxidoreductase, partial [Polyangiaceae bacterium]|nr:Gfo/Idh/MocA family oxidoreductase [Polyangiaceae bacterium]
MTQDLRIGVIGLGYAGTRHARALQDGRIPGARLHAVCDQDPGRAAAFPDSVHARLDDIFAEPALDAVVIATPHRSHVELCENALREGLSVLVEKPFGVHAAECRRALAAHSDAIRSAALHSATKRTETAPQEQVSARIQRSVMPLLLGVVHDYRVEPKFIWLKELIQRGELGRVVRFTWQATNFFRTEAYFQTSPWRGRFLTEGGGILVNQAPHLLDAVAWLFGVPRRLFASCGFGRYHQIEVEDDVNALLEYADGTRGNLQLSTGESPGTQRLDVSFDGGRVVVEGNEAVI